MSSPTDESKSEPANRFKQGLSLILTFLGLIYLLAVLSGWLPVKNKFGATEAIIFGTILLFNSDLIERINNVKWSGQGVEIGLREKVQNVEAVVKNVKIEQFDQKVEQEKQRDQINALRFMVNYFVTTHELKHLTKLAAEDTVFYYDKKRESFVDELVRLRALGFIDNFPGKGVRSMPEQGNLKEFFYITPRGREYLELRQSLREK